MEQEQSPEKKYDEERGKKILARIRASEKREEAWLKDAEAAEKAYMADSSADSGVGKLYDFNILHSNVETIVPAIYNSTPKPDIRPRRKEATGPAPKPPQQPVQQQQGPQAPGQPLQGQMPPQQPDPRAMAMFQQQMAQFQARKQADKDAKEFTHLLERSISVQIDDNRLDTEVEAAAQDAFLAGRGVVRLRFEGMYGQDERITFEATSWRDFRMGPAKRFEDVPWEAFRVIVSRETYDRMSDKSLIDQQMKDGDNILTSENDEDDIILWEYWDKLNGKVCFVRESDGLVIKEEDDPLGLPGFFPNGKPIQPITVTGRLTPVNPFKVYKALADELDRITKRINKIMSGVKVRGIVAGNAETLFRLAELGDNEIEVDANMEQWAQHGGLEKAIAWWPVEQAIKVLMELYKQREEVKSSIYEITGISDIVRGASDPRETMGAQKIKTQWGSLRIQKMQRLIARGVRDIFVIMSDILTTKFSSQTLTAMTGIQITEGMMRLMEDPVLRNYKVDVESDSTIRADLTQKKAEMGEFLKGSAAFFQTAAGIVQQMPEASEPLAEIYSASASLFNLGKQAEDALDRLVEGAKQSSQQKKPNPEEEKLKAETQAKQAELQMKGQEMALKAEEGKVDVSIKQAELAIRREELAIKREELRLKRIESEAKSLIEAERVDADRDYRREEMNLRVVEGDRKANLDERKQDSDERMAEEASKEKESTS